MEARKVLVPEDFACHRRGAGKFFEVLGDGPALASLLEALEERFNGNVFRLPSEDLQHRRNSNGQLSRFADLIEARRDKSGQMTLWERYSFEDLPVEIISHIYQLSSAQGC